MFNKKNIEKHYPRFITASVFLCFLFLHLKAIYSPTNENIAAASLSISAIFCGFLSTVFAILFSASSSRRTKGLKSSGAYNEIVDYLAAAFFWNFTAVTASLISIFFQPALAVELAPYLYIILLSISAGAVSSTYRITKLFILVLKLED